MSYEEKCRHFRKLVKKVRVPWSEDSLVLVVNRASLLENSVSQLGALGTVDFHKELGVFFEGEMGQDAGGLFKEWLNSVIAELFSAKKGLFVLADCDGIAYRIKPGSEKQAELFEFCGKVLAKAAFENIPINCPLATPLYKQLTGKKVLLQDLRRHDHDLYESLDFIKHNSVTDVIFHTFAVQDSEGQTIELRSGGSTEQVSDANKRDYVKLRKTWEVLGSVETQVDALQRGFHTVLPLKFVNYFDPGELELLMCGLPIVDVKEWESYTEYRGCFSSEHQVVRWFWEVVEELTQEELSNLLMFSMGTYRLPVEGFRTLKTLRGDTAHFTLQSVDFDSNAPFPRAHTCFNRLDLPLYDSKEQLRHYLHTALDYSIGFGLE
jgi:E3 ubiquitin-protein ligase HUWE1